MDDLARILVIEDDATIRALLEMALLGAGFKDVKSSARGDEGLEEVKRTKPDLVLLDLMLPGLDGFTIAKRIRELSELSATRIIMLTARTQNEDIVRGLTCGADDYVTKPFDRLAAQGDAHVGLVDPEPVEIHALRDRKPAPQHRPHPREQHKTVEGLRDVVVRPAGKSAHDVLVLRPRREHDDPRR